MSAVFLYIFKYIVIVLRVMKLLIDGIEPQFKVYKISETIENKFYIGKTKLSLKDRINVHRYSRQHCDVYFSDVGWNNVVVEIIDSANNEEELSIKEQEHIIKHKTKCKDLLLNKHYRDNTSVICNYNKIIYGPFLPSYIRFWSTKENKYILKIV